MVRKISLAVILLSFGVFQSHCIAGDEIKPRIQLRQVTIKNVAYSSDGNFFAVPNFITAGSVGVFSVGNGGAIVPFPLRFSEKDFYRARGVFYYAKSKDTSTELIFLPLQEYLSGYSVAFSRQGNALAVAGADKMFIYSAQNWQIIKTVALPKVSRTVFSPDNRWMAAVADGRIHIISLLKSNAPDTLNAITQIAESDFITTSTIDPESGCKFADVAFSSDSRLIAAYEYKNIMTEHTTRIRIFETNSGNEERQLPYFEEKVLNTPDAHYPLVSFFAEDTAIAVTLLKSVFGKVVVIKRNDGKRITEFKGNCHALSNDGSLLAAGGSVYRTSTWKKIGKYSSSATCLAFSPENTLLVTTPESLLRFRYSLADK
jgi:WD40 repeat protein